MPSAFDRVEQGLAEQVWNMVLPLQISADPQELKAFGPNTAPSPAVFYALCPRHSYLPLVAANAKAFFMDLFELSSDPNDSEIWFSYQNEPLKWHFPIGLLFDMFQAATPSTVPPTPWKIHIHFGGFPADKLIKFPSSGTLFDFFMSSIKEADHLRNGSTKKVMALSKADQLSLWDGLCQNDSQKFWAVNLKLVVIEDGSTPPRAIPMRIYSESKAVLQEPVPCVNRETGADLTLGDVLNLASIETFPDPQAYQTHVPLVHGTIPKAETPILWLSQNMSFPDGFLHVVIRSRE
ncbi:autophagy protein Apg5-domain-containing protein [Polychytrium aggregatum]|uniref:autophagy protein Apg5-domain-containing protein n=1 Tax=Polychytrium aggregatum TaxID=110093 RepID=UPI0022FF1F03|nr:autophagy protein Apg5-domain-containing protein [Polychytrium aggregatum]KAI9205737.1 autophagy protein Apg5-domain-containing protein [Polychytrium aggregatum]